MTLTTVREINATIRTGAHVVALYETREKAGVVGRIYQARRHKGQLQGKVLATGRWCRLVDVWTR